jgi:hypothetical protein
VHLSAFDRGPQSWRAKITPKLDFPSHFGRFYRPDEGIIDDAVAAVFFGRVDRSDRKGAPLHGIKRAD